MNDNHYDELDDLKSHIMGCALGGNRTTEVMGRLV
jgi:hypothetical protein